MYISPISQSINYNRYSSSPKRVSNPSFQAELSNKACNRVLNMLKEKVTSVTNCPSAEDMKPIIDNMAKRWDKVIPNKSLGIMVIPETNLADFLGKEASKFDTKNTRGICIAVGDKYGPVETWSKCYEAIAVLLPKSLLKPNFN